MKRTTALCLLLLLTAALSSQAHAQQVEIGPRLLYDFGDLEEMAVGADLRVGMPAFPVLFNAAFDYYLVDDGRFAERNVYQINLNALYEFGVDNRVFTPYAGVGLGLTRFSQETAAGDASETETGFNVLGGAVFGFGSLRPFFQFQATLGDTEVSTVGGGLLFSLGG